MIIGLTVLGGIIVANTAMVVVDSLITMIF
jgi:hypothetical protein